MVIDRLPKTAKAPVVSMDGDCRDLRLDAYRGLGLWFIFLDHIPNNAFGLLTLRNYGFSDASEVFVFVSGYTCMLSYGGALREMGWPTTVARALRRGWAIYAAFLLTLIAYFALVWLAGGGSLYVEETNTAPFFQDPGAAILHAAAMQYAPVNTDILPTFVMLHLAFPPLLWLLTRSAGVALAASFLLYLLVQLFKWHLPAWPSGELYFNPLAWQVLFVCGAWYAYEGAGRLRTIIQSRAALIVALIYLTLSLAVTLSWQIKALEGLMPETLSKLVYPIDKSNLAPARLLHFFALAVVALRLTPSDWRGLTNPLMTAMIRCGENSLAMYCLSILLAFIGHVMLVRFSGAVPMQVAVSIAGIAIMIAIATVMTWTAKQDRPGPRLF